MAESSETEEIGTDVMHIRTRMMELGVECDGKWHSSIGELLRFNEERWTRRELITVDPSPPARDRLVVFSFPREHYRTVNATPEGVGIWQVWLWPEGSEQPTGWACIQAYEQPNRHTRLHFRDGRLWQGMRAKTEKSIGPAFIEFAEYIVREVLAADVGPSSRRKGAPLLEERADVEERRTKAREYLDLVKNGIPKEVASQRVGHARKTLEQWVKRLL